MMTIKDLHDQHLILFKAVTGSKAYGLDTALSDTDIKGVFYLPKHDFFGLGYIPQISNETNDEVYYELGRFVELLSKNNPTAMELLASPVDCVLERHPLMGSFELHELLNKELVESFVQYALQQVRKAKGLNKKINNPHSAERKTLLDFAYVLQGSASYPMVPWLRDQHMHPQFCGLTKLNHSKNVYALYYDRHEDGIYRGILAKIESQEVALSAIPKGEEAVTLLFVNHEAYSSYCKDYLAYREWEKKRNAQRYARTMAHGRGYDAKNMMHTIRLLEVAKDLVATGELLIKRTNRTELLEIKSGKWTYEQLCDQAEVLQTEIADLYPKSSLPESLDSNKLLQSLVQVREILYG
ncbi:nucleotidyltransferase domain-containing protein [Sphingobacterium sp. SRCM116780]|uniref:DNA polymerase beta superfamily protein n=1 Tax=Sphingobacterium sp. SRCM116780 TaxID=2907623 RepID=UPI001F3EC570|nr:nucleotidyltransferase domain-containing protein [Sphingobacterium sp. SRCM116780]UIR57360.1 nucleotidyltransferase domain-containing protein [Sphingobacterium sp. SRCM116780]